MSEHEEGFKELLKEDKRFKIPLILLSVVATGVVAFLLCTMKAEATTGGIGPGGVTSQEQVPLTITYAGTKGCKFRTFGRMAPATRSTYRLELTIEAYRQGYWQQVLPGQASGINRKGHHPSLAVWLNPHAMTRIDRHRHRVVIEQTFETTTRDQPDSPGAVTAYGRTVPLHQSDCEPDPTDPD